MTNKEFDLLDELYFVTSFEDLESALEWPVEELFSILGSAIENGWVKCLEKKTEHEVVFSATELRNKYTEVFFLASKKGLMQHNSK